MLERHHYFTSLLHSLPYAVAVLQGNSQYPSVQGLVRLYQTSPGVLIAVEAFGLPLPSEPCEEMIFALHIHEGEVCQGDYTSALAHYNPENCPHPHHAGDLPPLFSNNGYAFAVFLTDRFPLREVLGKAVILHRGPDDFTTQPGGNAGDRMACGLIQPTRR